jgi:hypothetical protein
VAGGLGASSVSAETIDSVLAGIDGVNSAVSNIKDQLNSVLMTPDNKVKHDAAMSELGDLFENKFTDAVGYVIETFSESSGSSTENGE